MARYRAPPRPHAENSEGPLENYTRAPVRTALGKAERAVQLRLETLAELEGGEWRDFGRARLLMTH